MKKLFLITILIFLTACSNTPDVVPISETDIKQNTDIVLGKIEKLPLKNEKYSHQAYPYHNLSFKDIPASEFNNTLIIGSCFYQEWVEGDADILKDIFPDGMKGVVFQNCNLDNIYIPTGNFIKDGTAKKIKVQNDWEDWILNNNLKPIEPMNKEMRIKKGIDINPENIPAKKLTNKQREAFEELLK